MIYKISPTHAVPLDVRMDVETNAAPPPIVAYETQVSPPASADSTLAGPAVTVGAVDVIADTQLTMAFLLNAKVDGVTYTGVISLSQGGVDLPIDSGGTAIDEIRVNFDFASLAVTVRLN